jgi:hypothetical protein
MDREMKTPQIPINAGEAGGEIYDASTPNVRKLRDDRATLLQRCCPPAANLYRLKPSSAVRWFVGKFYPHVSLEF